MARRGRLIRDVSQKECPWLSKKFKAGQVVYEFNGCTYGCIGDGVAISEKPDQNPFYELPANAIKWETK